MKVHMSLLVLMIILTLTIIMYPPYRHVPLDDQKAIEIQRGLVKEIAQASHPVLSDDMVLLVRAGREVQIEPLIFKELAATGKWDQTHFLQLLLSHAFEFVIILNEYEYTAEMLAAIARAYPNIERFGPYTIRRQAVSIGEVRSSLLA
jgi:hypothetical protein